MDPPLVSHSFPLLASIVSANQHSSSTSSSALLLLPLLLLKPVLSFSHPSIPPRCLPFFSASPLPRSQLCFFFLLRFFGGVWTTEKRLSQSAQRGSDKSCQFTCSDCSSPPPPVSKTQCNYNPRIGKRTKRRSVSDQRPGSNTHLSQSGLFHRGRFCNRQNRAGLNGKRSYYLPFLIELPWKKQKHKTKSTQEAGEVLWLRLSIWKLLSLLI